MKNSDTSNFKCLRCGDCCKWHGYVRLSEAEADRIAIRLGMDIVDFIGTMTVITEDRRSLSLDENPDGTCIFFLDNPPRCKIYDVRPAQCRNFPHKWKNSSAKFQCRNNSGFQNRD
jgi:hypothetical protein